MANIQRLVEIEKRGLPLTPEQSGRLAEARRRNLLPAAAINETEQKQSSYLRGLIQNIGEGTLLGFSDEITGLLVASAAEVRDVLTRGNDGQTFNEVRKDVTGLQSESREQFAEENPGTALAAQIVGGVATGGVGGARATAAATGTKLGGKLLTGATSAVGRGSQLAGRSAIAGVPGGAVFGAGAAEGGIEERAKGAAKGAAIGAVASPVLGGAAVAASRGGIRTANAIGRGVRNIKRRVTDTDEKMVIRSIAKTFKDDDLSTATAARNKKLMGEEATLADLGGIKPEQGVSLVDRAEALVQAPGKARSIGTKSIMSRMRGQRQRVGSYVRSKISGKADDYASEAESIVKKRAAQSDTKYKEAFLSDIDNTAGRLPELMKNGEIAPLLKTAVNRLKDNVDIDEGLRVGLDANNPNVRVWDQVKKMLGDKVGNAIQRGEGTEGKAYAGQLTSIKKVLLNELDNQVPAYKAARKVFADESSMLNALERGTEVLKKLNDPKAGAEATIKEFQAMSRGEQDMFRLGVGRFINNLINKTDDTLEGLPPASLLKQFYGSPAKRSVINMVIPKKSDQRAFERLLTTERKMHDTANKVLKGSQTSRRQDQGATLPAAAEAAAEAFYATTGNRWAALKLLSRAFGAGIKNTPEIRAKEAELLFSKDAVVIRKTLKEVNKILGKKAPSWAKSAEKMDNKQIFTWTSESQNRSKLVQLLGSKDGLRAAVAGQQAGDDESLSQQTLDAISKGDK